VRPTGFPQSIPITPQPHIEQAGITGNYLIIYHQFTIVRNITNNITEEKQSNGNRKFQTKKRFQRSP